MRFSSERHATEMEKIKGSPYHLNTERSFGAVSQTTHINNVSKATPK
jgi:hypothetical protein